MTTALVYPSNHAGLQVQKAGTVDFKAFQKVSLLDYPGKVSAIVWVGGCNFRCPFCYNRDLVLNPDALPSIPEAEILDYPDAKREWIDGLVVTGGEPTIYSGLLDFLSKIKELGLAVKLDTNGSNPLMLEEILRRRLADYVALDVKAPLLAEKYGMASGLRDGEKIYKAVRRSISLLLGSNGVEYEFRTTAAPRLLDKRDLLLIAEELKGAKRYFLQQFKQTKTHVDESYSDLVPFPIAELEEIMRKVAGYFEVCGVRK